MDHAEDTSSPSPTVNRKTKTQFLTPCRRMGLARKSPASSGSWYANKSSPSTISPYKSPLKVSQENYPDTLHSDDVVVQNQVTPSRNRKTFPIRQLTKRLKVNHTFHSPQCNDGSQDSSLSKKSESNSSIDVSHDLTSKMSSENASCFDTYLETEIIIPTEFITEESLKGIRDRIKEKEEKLKDLKLTQLYKRKHDVTTLQRLIQTWLEGCQAALQELQSVLLQQGHHLSIEELLNQLNIPHQLVKYRVDLEDFE